MSTMNEKRDAESEFRDDLAHIQDLAVDLVARFPDQRVEVIDYLRYTAGMLEDGELDSTIEEQARLNRGESNFIPVDRSGSPSR